MAASNVQYYEKIAKIQESQHSSERKRMELEQELNSYTKHDQRMAKLKVVRLQTYWKKICEDEKRSKWRNEQLLKEMDQLESMMTSASAPTDKLRVMKKQYEDYIEKKYPNWKEKVTQQARMKVKLQQFQQQVEQQKMYADQQLKQQQEQQQMYADLQLEQRQEQHRMYADLHLKQQQEQDEMRYVCSAAACQTDGLPMKPSTPSYNGRSGYTTAESLDYSVGQAILGKKAAYRMDGAASPGEMLMPRGSDTMSTLPTGTTLGSVLDGTKDHTDGKPLSSLNQYPHDGNQPAQDFHNPGVIEGAHEHRATTYAAAQPPSYSSQLESYPADYDSQPIKQTDDFRNQPQVHSQQPAASHHQKHLSSAPAPTAPAPATPALSAPAPSQQSSQPPVMMSEQQPENYQREPQAAAASQHKPSVEVTHPPLSPQESEDRPHPQCAEVQHMHPDNESVEAVESSRIADRTEEDISDFEGEVDLPMSEPSSPKKRDEQGSPVPAPQSARSQGSRRSIDVKSPEPEDRSVYMQADITLMGLYNLLNAIEAAIPLASNPDLFYLSEMPPASVRQEILSNGNKGATLSHVDAISISMVALDQLPLLVMQCEGGALLPDKMLYRQTSTVIASAIRMQIHPTGQAFWDRLYEHFIQLLKYKIMSPETIGERFGTWLVNQDSPYEEQSQKIITSLMENVDPEDLAPSPGSTSTFSTMPKISIPPSAFKTEETVPEYKENQIKEENDDFFDTKPAPLAPNVSLNLTQTAAYKQLLGDPVSTQNTLSYQESESEDDIEQQLMVSSKMSSSKPPPSGGTFNKPTIESSPETSRASSPDPVYNVSGAAAAPAYVASTLNTGRSTGKSTGTWSLSSSKAERKPAFRVGDSDTDEDVDLMATGGDSKKEEPDDFDFYA